MISIYSSTVDVQAYHYSSDVISMTRSPEDFIRVEKVVKSSFVYSFSRDRRVKII